jgi:hypothetical protein
MRHPWPAELPPLKPHTSYATLKAHPRYEDAKRRGDADQAVNLCYELYNEQVMLWLDASFNDREPPVIVVAPSLPPGETNNALARSYALWLASQLGGEYAEDIIQSNAAVKRDLITSTYARLVQEQLYEGPVLAGRDYILADDMCTSGGTLASLHGFVRDGGGCVVCATSIANGSGDQVPLAIEPDTLEDILTAFGGHLAEVVVEELGYEVACLTEAEARFLLDRASVDAIRKGIAAARSV